MFFNISTPRILAFFFYKTCDFFSIFLTFIAIIQVFQPNRKSPLGFDNKLLENVFGHGLVFNFYYRKYKNFMQLAIFEVLKCCHFFKVFPASRATEPPLGFDYRLLHSF